MRRRLGPQLALIRRGDCDPSVRLDWERPPFRSLSVHRSSMTYLLRTMRAQDRIDGRQPLDLGENDYAVVDEARFGRIYMGVDSRQNEMAMVAQTMPASPPNSGVSETLDEAKAALEAGNTNLSDEPARASTMTSRFPEPWRIVKIPNGFAVEDASGRQLGVFCGQADPNTAGHAGIPVIEEARQIAVDFARLPELLKQTSGQNEVAPSPDDDEPAKLETSCPLQGAPETWHSTRGHRHLNRTSRDFWQSGAISNRISSGPDGW